MLRPAAAFALALCASPALADDPERGLELADLWCNGCHVVRQHDPGWHSGNVSPRFSLLTRTTPERLTALLRGGHGSIDAIRRLPDADYADILAHIKRLRPEEQ